MSQFNSFDEKRHTAIYVRISTASQKTDRQQEGKRGQLEFPTQIDNYHSFLLPGEFEADIPPF